MVGWQRSLQSLVHHVGKRMERDICAAGNLSCAYTNLAPTLGQSSYLHRASTPKILRPFHQYLQQLGISSSRNLLVESSSDSPPMSSPLTPPVLAITSGKTEDQAVAKPAKVQAILKNIKQSCRAEKKRNEEGLELEEEERMKKKNRRLKEEVQSREEHKNFRSPHFGQIPPSFQSPKKVNLVAQLVRGMRVEDALVQLQVTIKRAAKTVYQVIHSARANATHNHALDPDRLIVSEAFVGKGYFKKRISYHAKGKCGMKVRPECRLTVVVREMTAEELAEIARLRVNNYRKLTKRERRLVPHQLIETSSIWNRKINKTNGPMPA